MVWTIKAKKFFAACFLGLGLLFLCWGLSVMLNIADYGDSDIVSGVGSVCCLGILIASLFFFVIGVYLWDHAKKDEQKIDVRRQDADKKPSKKVTGGIFDRVNQIIRDLSMPGILAIGFVLGLIISPFLWFPFMLAVFLVKYLNGVNLLKMSASDIFWLSICFFVGFGSFRDYVPSLLGSVCLLSSGAMLLVSLFSALFFFMEKLNKKGAKK